MKGIKHPNELMNILYSYLLKILSRRQLPSNEKWDFITKN